jgi:hypothetical protein
MPRNKSVSSMQRGIEVDPRFADLSWGTMVALQQKPHVYAGTVPPAEVARRRAKNRAARRARRGNTAAIARQARLNCDHTPRFRRGQAPDPLRLHVNEVAS